MSGRCFNLTGRGGGGGYFIFLKHSFPIQVSFFQHRWRAIAAAFWEKPWKIWKHIRALMERKKKKKGSRDPVFKSCSGECPRTGSGWNESRQLWHHSLLLYAMGSPLAPLRQTIFLFSAARKLADMWSIEGIPAGGMKAGGQPLIWRGVKRGSWEGEWKRAQGVHPAPGNRESLWLELQNVKMVCEGQLWNCHSWINAADAQFLVKTAFRKMTWP